MKEVKKIHKMISGALPIHNEERFLPYCLKGLENANLDELCIYLDRCTDNSFALIRRWIEVARPNFYVKIKTASQKPPWKNPFPYVFQQAFDMTGGDIIYTMAADIYYTNALSIFDEKYFKHHDFVSFSFRNYDLTTPKAYTVYIWLLEKMRGRKGHPFPFGRGALALTRKLWNRIGGYRDVGYADGPYADEYDLINRCAETGAKMSVVPSKLLHLRRDKNYYEEGLARAEIGMRFRDTLRHGFLQLKPLSIVGHLHYRHFVDHPLRPNWLNPRKDRKIKPLP